MYSHKHLLFACAGYANEVMSNTNVAENSLPISITTTLSNFIANSSSTHIPEEWRKLGRLHILDTLASIVACRNLETATVGRKYSLSLSGGTGSSSATILGTHHRASVVDAVFAGAMAGHGAEINDFIPSAYVQPGPAIVSVAIGLAESRGLSGDGVLRAVVTGYEMASRFPKAIGTGNLRKAGLANHGIGPTFGAAAAAASLLKLPPDRIADVFAYCAQQASGSWQWLLDTEHIEKLFVFAGMGARAGLHAALMAEAGFRGVPDSLDNSGGWLQSSAFPGGDSNLTGLVTDLGRRTELTETGFKRYLVGGPTQPAVHGLLTLLPNITTNQEAKATIAMPGSADSFRNAAMPALNLRYLFAIILLDGRLDFIDAQSRKRLQTDTAVQDLVRKVEVVQDSTQEAPKGQPRTESARVIIEQVSGKCHEIFVPYVKGYPSHPMSENEVEEKALGLMALFLGVEKAQVVIAKVRELDRTSRVDELVHLIAR
ncbi:MmgE/PrpD family protein [Tothia fuscella]|uniref:MmgE/PrpD family protein n=1 Tax=Tothia fuscella TaxID=1048955 RepID=A0A9P4NSN9_9PEZI|nr:MmgE/PrpD family protein [Tothia fuscella]